MHEQLITPVPTISMVHPDEGRIVVNADQASDYLAKGYRPAEAAELTLPTPAEKQAASAVTPPPAP